MFFKNLYIYYLTEPFAITPEALNTALEKEAFTPCGPMQYISSGFARPMDDYGHLLAETIGKRTMICQQIETKTLPAAAINQKLKEAVLLLSDPPSRKEQGEMRQSIIDRYLPKVLTKTTRLHACLTPDYLLIDTASENKALELIVQLRKAVGSVPVKPLTTRISPVQTMTYLVHTQLPNFPFEMEDTCTLQDPIETSHKVKLTGHNLTTIGDNEDLNNLNIVSLALSAPGQLGFTVNDKLVLSKMHFLDAFMGERNNDEAETYADRWAADFAIMGGYFDKFIPTLIEAFGGVE